LVPLASSATTISVFEGLTPGSLAAMQYLPVATCVTVATFREGPLTSPAAVTAPKARAVPAGPVPPAAPGGPERPGWAESVAEPGGP